MSSVPQEQRGRGAHAPFRHDPTEVLGAVPRESGDEQPAQWLGPYRLVQRLGEGGMGVVHLALDERGRAVAIKVLRDHVAHDAVARARLAREVSTLRRVQHPRVAPVLDADPEGPRPYVVTRYVPGDPLDSWVASHGPMGADGLARLGRGLAEALGAIHAAGVVHRDLKPGNVLMPHGEPVVIDFGIAHVADEARLTSTGLVMGTPGYLSPELLDGHPVDASTDWFAWAATLLFAATGRPPFGKGPLEAVLHRVRRGEPDLAGVDERLRPVLLAGLRPVAADRPRQEQILAALDVYGAGGDTGSIVGLTRSPSGGSGGGSAGASSASGASGASVAQTARSPRGGSSSGAPAAAGSSPSSSGGSTGRGSDRGGWVARASAATRGWFTGGGAAGSAAGAAGASGAGGASGGPGAARAGSGSSAAGASAPSGAASQASEPAATRAQTVSGTRIMPAGSSGSSGPSTSRPSGPPVGAPAWREPQAYAGFRSQAPGYAPAPTRPQTPRPAERPRFWQQKPSAPPRGHGGYDSGSGYAPDGYGYPARVDPSGARGPGGYGEQPEARPRTGPRLRHGVQLPLVALLAALAGLAMCYPVIAVLIAAAWSVVARTVDSAAMAIAAGAAERGSRRSDVPLAVLGSPVRAIPAILTTVMVVIVSGVVAAGAAVGAAALLTGSTGYRMSLESEPVLAIGLATGVLVGWWGPAGSSLRRGSRRTMRALTLGRPGALVVTVALLLVGAYFAVRSQASGVTPDWFPIAESFVRGLLGPF